MARDCSSSPVAVVFFAVFGALGLQSVVYLVLSFGEKIGKDIPNCNPNEKLSFLAFLFQMSFLKSGCHLPGFELISLPRE